MSDDEIKKIMRGCGIAPNTIFQEWGFLVDGIPEELRRAFQLVEQATLERSVKECEAISALLFSPTEAVGATCCADRLRALKDSHE